MHVVQSQRSRQLEYFEPVLHSLQLVCYSEHLASSSEPSGHLIPPEQSRPRHPLIPGVTFGRKVDKYARSIHFPVKVHFCRGHPGGPLSALYCIFNLENGRRCADGPVSDFAGRLDCERLQQHRATASSDTLELT